MENYDHCSLFLDPSQTLPHVSNCNSLHHQFGDEFHSWLAPVETVAGDRAASASKSHSQAEKRRRDRINAQLTSLRKLIPKSDKYWALVVFIMHFWDHGKVLFTQQNNTHE
ncbi:hypothetical protein HN51_032207 [Arachis hypogaea]